MEAITSLIHPEMLPAHGGSVSTLKIKTISSFLLSEAIVVSNSEISRAKQTIVNSLTVIGLKSVSNWRWISRLWVRRTRAQFGERRNPECRSDGEEAFRRCSCECRDNQVRHIHCRRRQGLLQQHIPTCTRSRASITSICAGFSRSRRNRLETWISLRWQKGPLCAVEHVFPRAGHRFCLRHIMEKIAKVPLTDEHHLICSIAHSDCENENKLYRAKLRQATAGVVESHDKLD